MMGHRADDGSSSRWWVIEPIMGHRVDDGSSSRWWVTELIICRGSIHDLLVFFAFSFFFLNKSLIMVLMINNGFNSKESLNQNGSIRDHLMLQYRLVVNEIWAWFPRSLYTFFIRCVFVYERASNYSWKITNRVMNILKRSLLYGIKWLCPLWP